MFKRTPASRAVLEADRAFKSAEPQTTEYAKAQKAFHDNRERLKAERLTREAGGQRGRERKTSS
jgi:hypothetical protein